MKRCSVGLLVLLAAVLLAQAGPAKLSPWSERDRVNHLLGLHVESSDGQTLGRVRNFVVDLPTGEVKYAIISSGGVLGVGKGLRIAPAPALSVATAKKGVLALNITAYAWKNAPEFKKYELGVLDSPSVAMPIYHFYGVSYRREEHLAHRPDGQVTRLSATTPEARHAPASRAESAHSDVRPMQLASDIIGQDVVIRQQEALGEVSDLLVDLSGAKPTLAIISGGRLLKKQDCFAVPLRSLSATSGRKVVLDANQGMLEQAPSFDEKAWQTAANTPGNTIFRFER